MWGNNVARGLGSNCTAVDRALSQPSGGPLSLAALPILMLP
jgi:hypothetical protein